MATKRKRAKKAIKKTGTKTGTMISPKSGAVCPTGAHPGNTGGKKGRSGRKPDAYKQFMRDVVNSPTARKAVETVINDPKHQHFASVWRHLVEQTEGKPVQPIGGEGGGPIPISLEAATDDLLGQLARIATRQEP